MRHESEVLGMETGGYSFHLDWDDQREIMQNDHMKTREFLVNLELSAWNNYGITIKDITFRRGYPISCHIMFFDYMDDGEMVEHALCKLAELSLTHRMMYMTDVGQIYVTESENHQTNIDADLLDTVSRTYLEKGKLEEETMRFTM